MNRPNDELLMRYYDGELSEEEAVALERTLDGEAARIVEGLDQLGAVLRGVGEKQGDAAGDIAGAVLERIEAEERSAPMPLKIAPPQAARWVAPAAVAVLAAAASFALWVISGSEPAAPVARVVPPPTLPSEPIPTVVAPAPAPEAPIIEEEDVLPAVAIEAVDFGSHNGAIFMVSAGAEATPVVWLTDEAVERTEPL